MDVDATYLPVGHMRQIARVTGLEGGSITGGRYRTGALGVAAALSR